MCVDICVGCECVGCECVGCECVGMCVGCEYVVMCDVCGVCGCVWTYVRGVSVWAYV